MWPVTRAGTQPPLQPRDQACLARDGRDRHGGQRQPGHPRRAGCGQRRTDHRLRSSVGRCGIGAQKVQHPDRLPPLPPGQKCGKADHAPVLPRDDGRVISQPTDRKAPHGKAALVLILMLWLTAIGSFVQTFPSQRESRGDFLTDGSFIVLCAIATILLLRAPRIPTATTPTTAAIAPTDPRS